MVVVESAGITDVGKKRAKNEDAILIDKNLNLFVVADGMGGHLAGEIASSLVVETLKTQLKTNGKTSMADDTISDDNTCSEHAKRLVSSIKMANAKVYQESSDNESCRGMASTVSAVFFSDEMFVAANVGDSPIYLVNNGDIEPISVAHTFADEQTHGDSEKNIELQNKYQHILTRGVGVKKTVKVDFCEIPYLKGDQLIICSDGLSNKVSAKEIFNEVTRHAPKKACRMLVDMANERGGDDNITIIVLKIKKTNKNPISFHISHTGKKLYNFFHKLIQ